MKIVDKPIEWLRPYENNPRNNEQAVESVANSIKEFGFKVPIVATIDEENLKGMTKSELISYIKTMQDTSPTTVFYEDKPVRNDIHPTMKPLKLIARCVLNSSKKGDKVLDSFNGGGSTLMVCERSERVCYAMELDPVYVERTIKRWEEETGLTAEKVS